MLYNEIGFFLVLLPTIYLGIVAANARRRWYPARLFLSGLIVFIVGSIARYEVLYRFYDGGGDAVRYFEAGLVRAQELRALELTPLSPAYWSLRGARWGTGFIEQISGLVLAIIGPTLRGEFVVFALFGFLGVFLIAKAYRWVNPVARSLTFAGWIWLWPSIWFWPSSVGKESLVLLSFGLAAYGYVGDGLRHRWGFIAAGLGLSFVIRPHVTAVLVMSMSVATVLAPSGGRLTPRRVFQIVATIVVSVFVLQAAQARLGLDDADLEGMVEYAAYHSQQTLQGGSNVGAPSGVLAPAQAFINVWARPFPWEAHNMTAAISALEMMLLWFLVLLHRRELMASLRHWRHNRMLRFALPLMAAYTLMIGLTFGNLGIIARQRAPMFPFFLVLLVGVGHQVPMLARFLLPGWFRARVFRGRTAVQAT